MPAPPSTALTDTLEAADEQILRATAWSPAPRRGSGAAWSAWRPRAPGWSCSTSSRRRSSGPSASCARRRPVEAVSGDVAERADVRRAVELAVERFGGLDVLAGIAGITEFSSVLELGDESWRRILDVNLTGMFIATQEAGRVMAARGGGAIVLMASTNAFYPEAHTAPYSTRLVGFVRAASLDLGQHGIRINAVNPGIINTRLSKVLIDDPIGGPEYLRRILLPLGEPADIAAVAFLASRRRRLHDRRGRRRRTRRYSGVVLEVEDIGLGEHGFGPGGPRR